MGPIGHVLRVWPAGKTCILMSFHCRLLVVAVEGSKRSPELIQLLDMHTHFASGIPGRKDITNTATTGTTLCHYCYYYNATYRNLQNSIGFKRIYYSQIEVVIVLCTGVSQLFTHCVSISATETIITHIAPLSIAVHLH